MTSLFLFFQECVKHFQAGKEVRRGSVVSKTTPEAEAMSHIEIYLANARTRVKRKLSQELLQANILDIKPLM